MFQLNGHLFDFWINFCRYGVTEMKAVCFQILTIGSLLSFFFIFQILGFSKSYSQTTHGGKVCHCYLAGNIIIDCNDAWKGGVAAHYDWGEEVMSEPITVQAETPYTQERCFYRPTPITSPNAPPPPCQSDAECNDYCHQTPAYQKLLQTRRNTLGKKFNWCYQYYLDACTQDVPNSIFGKWYEIDEEGNATIVVYGECR